MDIMLPEGMRIPSLSERAWFYSHIFDPDESKDFLKIYPSPVYAIDIGNESGIYLPTFAKYINKLVYISKYDSIKEKLSKYAPEDVYYSRNIVKDPKVCALCEKHSTDCPDCVNLAMQELAFDIDSENIKCSICKKDKKKSIYSFCAHQLRDSKQWAIRLYNYLVEEKKYRDVRIVYSGRGYHLHVLDKDAYSLSPDARKNMAESLKRKGYPIDAWVTSGNIDLIRLPGSLHGLVNRIVKEIKKEEIEQFDPIDSKEVIPPYPPSVNNHSLTRSFA